MVEKSKAGEIKLAYVDETGFAHAQPNRNAWTEKGEVHLITAERGKRLNVLAALISTGALFSAMFWETTTAAAFAGFLGLLLKSVGGPLTVILDNASIHKAKQGLRTRIAYDQIRRNHMIVRKVSTAEGAPSRRLPPHDLRAGHGRPGWCVPENP